MARYILYVNFMDRIIEKPLPAEDNRSLYLDFKDIADECRVKIEVFDGVWSFVSDESCDLSVNGKKSDAVVLRDKEIVNAGMKSGINFVIMVYEVNADIVNFTKYSLKDKSRVSVGKSQSCDIIADSVYLSAEHGEFTKHDDTWVYSDNSLNGSYLNGKRVTEPAELKMFDTVSMVGFKMVFLGDAIAVNRRDIAVCSLGKENEPIYADNTAKSERGLFLRSPRTVEPLFDGTLEIEPPPQPVRQKNQPLIFVIGPSVTMPLPILMSTYINSRLNSGSRSYLGIIASVGMSAIIGAGWAIAHYLYNRKIIKSEEAFRIDAYKEYIVNNEQLIKKEQNYDSSVLINQYLSSAEIISGQSSDGCSVWSRNIRHDDFLVIRLGTGNVDFSSHLSVPKQRFSLYKDKMAELPHRLYEKYRYIPGSVVTLGMKDINMLGIIGEKQYTDAAAMNILIQTAALHCYTDVRIAAFFRSDETELFSWLRWLPHSNSEDMRLRMTACGGTSQQNIIYHLDEVLRTRIEKLNEENFSGDFYPHYIVFCTDREIFDGDSIERYIPMAEKLGFTFILDYKRMDLLPNECGKILQCDSDFMGAYDLSGKRGDMDRLSLDMINEGLADNFARKLSGMRVREYSTGEIPRSVDFFGMTGIDDLKNWNLIRKYKENRVYEGVRSFIGLGMGGKPVYLDISEMKYGPHGLVAGTTGSGKSETLQTFIISLALNYSPDELAFILIDFKGGGMANAFAGMPHTAGILTNIDDGSAGGSADESVIRRSLASFKSEMNYRLDIFNKYNISHIDSYIRLFREGSVAEPLPHLVIIADEFAELKKDQPEFIKELVSISRIGRSLGVHLILATQKPAGVVDDQIWSNSRFKLCLRVQDRQDSMGMLKRPDAAYLTRTGRAFLQVGNDEVFEQFQTGYSGAEYDPEDSGEKAAAAEMRMINIDGTTAVERIIKKKENGTGAKHIKQLEAAVGYITEVCRRAGLKNAKSLWQPALPKMFYIDDIIDEYGAASEGITVYIGKTDDYLNQRMYPAAINISECSNLMIVGMAGSGKTTMLQTMLVSVMKNYSCEQAVYYLLDFSSRTLKMFGRSKHCGLAAFSDDEEAVLRLMKYISAEMSRRKKLFAEENVGSYGEYVKRKRLPLIMLIIDNYYSFSQLYPEQTEIFAAITRDSAKYGIQAIITCNSLNDVRSKIQQNFSNYITLSLPEKGDYRSTLGLYAEFMPKNIKGRGLLREGDRLLEYQTALPCRGSNESERYKMIEAFVAEINLRDSDCAGAEKVRVLPHGQSYEAFYAENRSSDMLPLGYYTDDISVYGIKYTELFCYAVSSAAPEGTSLMLKNIMYAAKQEGIFTYCVKLRRDILTDTSSADKLCRTTEEVVDMLAALRSRFSERAVDKKKFLEEFSEGDFAGYLCEKHDRIMIVIDSMNEFMEMIYNISNKEDMHSITEAYFKNGAGMGIYFVIGFEAEAYGQNYFRTACRSFVDYHQSVHLGGRYDRQKLVEVNMTMSQKSKSCENYIGMVNIGSRAAEVYIPGGSKDDK